MIRRLIARLRGNRITGDGTGTSLPPFHPDIVAFAREMRGTGTIAERNAGEPVLAVWDDGAWQVMGERDAEIEMDNVGEHGEVLVNYIPIAAILTDLARDMRGETL